MDKIYLNNLQFYAFHGLNAEEKVLGQRFNVDVVLHTHAKKAGYSDKMEDSIHYGHAYKAVKAVVEGENFNLIEALAEHIAIALFARFDGLQACQVKVIKPDPPIVGHYDSVAVEIYREREGS